MSRLAVSLLVSAAALVGTACTTGKSITPDEPRSSPVPTTTVGIAAVPPTAAMPIEENTTPTATPQSPPGKLALGAPCKAEDTMHCGTKGRVAVLMESRGQPSLNRASPPCAMQRVPRGDFGGDGGACVDDGHVYLTGRCIECRVFSEWDITGVVAEMTDAQLTNAQRRVGLPADVPLRTQAAWRAAITKAQSWKQ